MTDDSNDQISLSESITTYLQSVKTAERNSAAIELSKFARWYGGERPLRGPVRHPHQQERIALRPGQQDREEGHAVGSHLDHLLHGPVSGSFHSHHDRPEGRCGERERPVASAPGLKALAQDGHGRRGDEGVGRPVRDHALERRGRLSARGRDGAGKRREERRRRTLPPTPPSRSDTSTRATGRP